VLYFPNPTTVCQYKTEHFLAGNRCASRARKKALSVLFKRENIPR
jgi:hypothetical protein